MSHRAPRTGSRRLRRLGMTGTALVAGLITAATVQSQAHATSGKSPAAARAMAAKAAHDAAPAVAAPAVTPHSSANACSSATQAALQAIAKAHAHPDSAPDARNAAALSAKRAYVCG